MMVQKEGTEGVCLTVLEALVVVEEEALVLVEEEAANTVGLYLGDHHPGGRGDGSKLQ